VRAPRRRAEAAVSGAQAEGLLTGGAWLDESDTIKPVKPATIASRWLSATRPTALRPRRGARAPDRWWAPLRCPTKRSSTRSLLARTEGIFAETAGGVTIATLQRLAREGIVRPDERVVAYVTGHGLKTLDAVEPTVGPTAVIAPTLDAFHEAFPPDRIQRSA
jgi:threonine synthase